MRVRILSIDGGGAKGIVPVIILEYIENRLKELAKNPKVRLSDFLDFTAGTASGAIISTMMLIPDEKGRPKYEVKDILSNSFKIGEAYYRKKNWKTLWGFIGPKYIISAVDSIHLEIFSHWQMKDLLKPALITGYDILNKAPVFFTNKNGSDKYTEYFVKDVVRGSCSAPGSLIPAQFRDGIFKNIVINANMIANNPSLIAMLEASKTPKILKKIKKLTPDNVLLLSLGTGQAKLPTHTFKKIKRWNKKNWFNTIICMGIQSSTIIPDYNLKSHFKKFNVESNYIRIDPDIILGSHDIMDTSEENIKNLLQDAKNYITENHNLLDDIALQLFNEDEIYSTMLF